MVYRPRHYLACVAALFLFAWEGDASTDRFAEAREPVDVEISKPDWLPAGGIEEGGFAQASQTSLPASLNLTGTQNFTLSGAPGQTVTLNLKAFVLSGAATFTLDGTATTKFIINVSRRFSLSGDSAISLAGGVDLTNVLFRINKGGNALVTGNAFLQGIINAPRRQLQLSQNTIVYGRVSARRVILSGNARIIPPPLVSP
jgi:hypothetical protein